MKLAVQLISTDFDGTLHAEFESPPVPLDLQALIGDLQLQGVRWVVNTGRDLSSVMEGLARCRLSIKPDYLVTVEREIYVHERTSYVPSEAWNRSCSDAHRELFLRIQPDIPDLFRWVNDRFAATVYADVWSPFCIIAGSNDDMDAIQLHLDEYCRQVGDLSLVRNDVYARFSHVAFNKGTALEEVARQHGIATDHVLAAGDHLNDLPMLDRKVARCLVAPDNAMPQVKAAVRAQHGYVSHQPWGHGVARGLEHYLGRDGSVRRPP
jgi:hydroxymethylpyrimidine pyrophosphatase-like HAD family hydrolase